MDTRAIFFSRQFLATAKESLDVYLGQSYSSVGHQYTLVGQTINLNPTWVGQNVRRFPRHVGQFYEWVGQCPWPTDILRPAWYNHDIIISALGTLKWQRIMVKMYDLHLFRYRQLATSKSMDSATGATSDWFLT